MIRTHQIALKPNKEQATLLSQHCGYARVAYNYVIEKFNATLDAGDPFDFYGVKRAFNGEKYATYEWCKGMSQNAAKNGMHNAQDAIRRFRKKQGRKPRFHSRFRKQSYQADNGRGTIHCCAKAIKLPVIGWVRMRECLRFDGEITTVTIKKQAGRWYACISVETADAFPSLKDGETIGIDMGVKTLATVSDGTVVENPHALYQSLKKLRQVDKAIARSRNTQGKTERSNRRTRLYLKRQKMYARIRHLRDDVAHKTTTALARTAGHIKVETLNLSGMVKNKKLSKAISDAGIGNFIRILEYKCKFYGCGFEKIDRWFPSSKLCSECRQKHVCLDLSDRVFVCQSCGMVMDRDLNAAVNIKQYDAVSSTESLNGRGDAVRPKPNGGGKPCEASIQTGEQVSFAFA